MTEQREQWSSRCEFLLVSIGMAVGVGNFWRFSYLAYANGGGAFLLPYAIALLVLGIPMFQLELALGQVCRRGTYHSLRAMHERLAGVGLAASLVSFIITLYYNVIVAWTLVYLVSCFYDPMPFSGESVAASEAYWFDSVLQRSNAIGAPGGGRLAMGTVVGLAVSWVAVFVAMRRGLRGWARAAYVLATAPYVLLLILLVRACTLSGAGDGIALLFRPDFARLLEPSVWIAASSQIFFSLGVGSGILIAFGSYSDTRQDVRADSLVVCTINCATSLLAGVVVFALLGHSAEQQGVAVADVVSGGEGLAFVVFPHGLTQLPAARFFAVCFFLLLLCLGLDSQFAMVEVGVTLAQDVGVLRWLEGRLIARQLRSEPAPTAVVEHAAAATARSAARERARELLLAMLCIVSFLLGLVFCTRSGIYWFELTDRYVAWALFVVCGFECFAVSRFFTADKALRAAVDDDGADGLGGATDAAEYIARGEAGDGAEGIGSDASDAPDSGGGAARGTKALADVLSRSTGLPSGYLVPTNLHRLWSVGTPAVCSLLALAALIMEVTQPLELDSPLGPRRPRGAARAYGLLVLLSPLVVIVVGVALPEIKVWFQRNRGAHPQRCCCNGRGTRRRGMGPGRHVRMRDTPAPSDIIEPVKAQDTDVTEVDVEQRRVVAHGHSQPMVL